MKRMVCGLLGLLVVVAACGGDDGGGEVSGEAVIVQMFDNRYEFTEVSVPVGGTVTFVGAGRNPHNAVAADGSWSTEDVVGGLEQLEGEEAVLTFDEAGEYVFFCTFHGNAGGTAWPAHSASAQPPNDEGPAPADSGNRPDPRDMCRPTGGGPSPAALGDPATESPSEWSGETRLVPQDYPTIQAAVDAATPGTWSSSIVVPIASRSR